MVAVRTIVLEVPTGMFRFGHNRTYGPQKVMSALLLKADMCGAAKNVRYGPTADIPPFDQPVGAGEQ
jgi:hypothetical protein